MDRSTVAVVGAGGFVGSALTAHLAKEGRESVGFTRKKPVIDEDGALVPELARCGVVCWLATVINPYLAATEPGLVERELLTFGSFLTAVAGLSDPPRVVLASSGGTIYDTDAVPPYRESSPVRPRAEYGRAKLRLEEMLHAAPVPGVVLRIANAYGPGQPVAPGQAVIAHWMHAIIQGRPITVFGSLDTARDYVYVDDIAAAFAAAAAAAGPLPGVINIASGEPTPLSVLLELLVELVPPGAVEVRRESARSFDVARTWLAVDTARDVLGWVPATPLRDGLAAAWADLRHRSTNAGIRTGA